MNNQPYNQYSKYLKKLYNSRVQKITVHSGLTCPNRDGTLGSLGCTYCNNDSFAPPPHLQGMPILEQINHGIKKSLKRYKNSNKYFVYFQSFSSTYGPLSELKELFLKALSHPQVIGLCIGTRPDCVNKDIINFLSDLAKDYDITIEYGLESISNPTLKSVNRGHDYSAFLDAIELTRDKGIKICTHLIFGLPGEVHNYHIETAKSLSKLPIDFIKIHQLQIIKNTPLAKQFEQNPFKVLELDEYLELVISFLEYLNPDFIIQRVIGSSTSDLLITPKWNIEVSAFNDRLAKIMINSNKSQGKLYINPNP